MRMKQVSVTDTETTCGVLLLVHSASSSLRSSSPVTCSARHRVRPSLAVTRPVLGGTLRPLPSAPRGADFRSLRA